MKTCVIYTRVSTDDQVTGFSLNVQEESCRKEAEKQGFEVLELFKDEGISAKTLNRPQFEEMLSYIRKNKVNAIIIYHSSRLSRNTLNFLSIQVFCSKYQVKLISATEPIGFETPEQKFLTTILSAVNQLDNESKGRTVSNNMRKRFMEGYTIQKPPKGYFMQEIDKRKQAVRDPKWFPVIQNLWRKGIAEKLTVTQLKNELQKFSDKPVFRSSTADIFKNKFYCGVLVSAAFGEAQGKHEAMITEDEYYQLQEIFHNRHISGITRHRLRDDFFLRYILKCAKCGSHLTSAYAKNKLGNPYGYYYCLRCEKRIYYPKNTLEPDFIDLLKRVIPKPNVVKYYMKLMEESYYKVKDQLSQSYDWVEKDIEKMESSLKNLNLKHAEGLYTDEEYLETKEEIKIKLIARKSLLNDKKIEIYDIEKMTNFLEYYLTHLDSVFQTADPKTRLLLGCSIFPKGIRFQNKSYLTPEIGYNYKLLRDFSKAMPRKYPLVSPYLTTDILSSWHSLYQQFNFLQAPVFAYKG